MEDNLRDANEDGERKARFVLVVHLAKDSHLGDERRMPNVVTLVKVFGSFSTTADFYFYFFFSSLSAASPRPAGTGRFSQSHFSYRVNLAAKKKIKNLSFSLPFNTASQSTNVNFTRSSRPRCCYNRLQITNPRRDLFVCDVPPHFALPITGG